MKVKSRKLLHWTVIVLLAAIAIAYILVCDFFLLCGWVGNDYKLGSIGFGMIAAPILLAYPFLPAK